MIVCVVYACVCVVYACVVVLLEYKLSQERAWWADVMIMDFLFPLLYNTLGEFVLPQYTGYFLSFLHANHIIIQYISVKPQQYYSAGGIGLDYAYIR